LVSSPVLHWTVKWLKNVEMTSFVVFLFASTLLDFRYSCIFILL
jgi:hypothetical protein